MITIRTYYIDLTLAGREHSMLHCTLMQYFQSGFDPEIVRNAIARMRLHENAVLIRGGRQAWFGMHFDVDVNLVEKTPALMQLHTAVYGLVRDMGRLLNPQWCGDGFNPHVSACEGQRLREGSITYATTIRLHEVVDISGSCAVLHTWSLRTP